MTKRIFDFGASGTLLLGLSPLLIVIATLIRLTSKGPAIFVQERAGLGGRAFRFYKYRTMTLEADPYGASPKSGDDPRLTSFGRFLRETSLDELPQLFNILKGDMTLVGPRPLYVAQIAEWTPHQRRRLEVKPGLTGLAQTSGRGELTREAKLALDVRYVERANWRLDLKIIIATVRQVFGGKAIYEQRYSETETTRGGRLARK
ncbi:MAG: sugar transferase [Planctomycetes bacterium]|nr:sugar transferase [Planctomycetota bacterium]